MKCEFHVGDRVLSIGVTRDGRGVKDLVGTVCKISRCNPCIGVSWDESLDFMHSCGGSCEDGHGWFVDNADLVLVQVTCNEDADFEMAIENKDYQLLNKHLYRVQKIASKNYALRHHIETSVDDKYDGKHSAALSMQTKKLIEIRGFNSLIEKNLKKVRINLLGEITLIISPSIILLG